jgi:hypothetical protein
MNILYLKFKLSNKKATFAPCEHEIYRQIIASIVVFDAAVDSSRIIWLIWFTKPTRGYTQFKMRGHFIVLQMADQEGNFLCLGIVYVILSVYNLCGPSARGIRWNITSGNISPTPLALGL